MGRGARESRRRPDGAAAVLMPVDTAAEGAAVLEEIEGPMGVLLWSALRDVACWAEAPRGGRQHLFGPAAADRAEQVRAHAPDPDLWFPLLALAAMADSPDATAPVRVAYACRRLGRWAGAAGAPRTQLAFVEAAASVLPEDGRLALDAGRLARDLALLPRGEAWLRRAARLSRGADWETYVWAYNGLAWLFWRAGSHPAARACAGRALRTARRRRLRALEAVTLHNLFVFTSTGEGAQLRQAYAYATAAVAAYGARADGLARLAHDIACFWMDQGRYARAQRVVAAVLARGGAQGGERMLVAANAARAAAGARDLRGYAAAAAEAEALLATAPAGERCTETLLMLARADGLAGEDAQAAARYQATASSAASRRESYFLHLAEDELGRLPGAAGRALPRPAPQDPGVDADADGERMAACLVDALSETAPA
jgi:hypothetical protein